MSQVVLDSAPAKDWLAPDIRITQYEIDQALRASEDPNTQVAAFIISPLEGHIMSRAANAFSHWAINSRGRDRAPNKYQWLLHAEARAIANAAKRGIRTEAARIYVTHAPCLNCANLIIAAGLDTVYVPRDSTNAEKWLESCADAVQAFNEAGVEYIVL